jgi:hypothetical protein
LVEVAIRIRYREPSARGNSGANVPTPGTLSEALPGRRRVDVDEAAVDGSVMEASPGRTSRKTREEERCRCRYGYYRENEAARD